VVQSKATGLIMPKARFDTPGHINPTYAIANHPGYLSVGAALLLQPGLPEGDAATFQPEDDEMLGGFETGAVAIPHFPRGAAGNASQGHDALRVSTAVLSGGIVYGSAAQYQRLLPTPAEDATSGLPDPLDDEVYSEAASVTGRYSYPHAGTGPPAAEARKSNLAHQVDQVLGDSEPSASGATGVWSIAGRT
jgi:hypothetical protein